MTVEINVSNIIYLALYLKNVITSTCNQYKNSFKLLYLYYMLCYYIFNVYKVLEIYIFHV